MEMVITIVSISIRLVVIYRMLPSKKNKLKRGTFVTEFSDYLEKLPCLRGNLLIVGDFNINWLENNDSERRNLFHILETFGLVVVVVYPLPWPLLVGGVRCSRLWSTSQLLRPSGQQCSHSGGVCPQIQGRQCGAYVGAVEEMMCVVCVDVTEGA